jgi:hypothetical protein
MDGKSKNLSDAPELVKVLEERGFNISAATHSSLFQLAEISLNRAPYPLERQLMKTVLNLSEATAKTTAVLIVENLPFKRLSLDIVDIFEGYDL